MDKVYTYGYDSQNMMRSLLSSNRDILYLYTADDERVWEYDLLANRSDYTIRDLDKKVLRVFDENNGVWAWKKDMIHRADAILASASYAGSYHYTVDHLGTPRYISNASRGQVGKHAYYPFGQESTSDTQNQEFAKFTGHERDTNFTGTLDYLDYMHARYYNPMLGRFMGVDPGRDWSLRVPGSWNAYTYCRNSPINAVDGDGRATKVVTVGTGAALGWGLYVAWNTPHPTAQGQTLGQVISRDVVDAAKSAKAVVSMLGASLAHIVTPNGVVLPDGKDINLVPTADGRKSGTDWVQIHNADEGSHGGIPHTHRPQAHVDPQSGTGRTKKATGATTAEEIDEADQNVKEGKL